MDERRGIAWWPRRQSVVLDVTLALATAVIDGITTGISQGFFLPGPVVGVCSALLGLSLVVRRRFPVGVAVLNIVVGTLTGAGGTASVVAVYTLGAYAASRRVVLITTGVAIAGFVVQPVPLLDLTDPVWLRLVVAVALFLPPVLLGLYMGTRKALIANLQERAERLEREQHLLTERARVEERARIAREMHDVVANRVSLMVVHSGALQAVVAQDPGKAAETAAVIGAVGRQALDELRQVIGVLRLGEETPPPAVPDIGDIESLVEQSRAIGMAVTLEVEGRPGAVPLAVARTAYRVVQESLTNVHKHAGDAPTRVALRHLADQIEISVENDPSAGRPGHQLPSGGNGLVGLRERVAALGGTLETGSGPAGGFTVRATVPT